MNINDRIKYIVETDYSSQTALAKEIGVSRVTVGSYVKNENKPNSEVLEKFYKLGYNINWLVSGKGSIRRSFINEEELDEYDRVVFEHFESFSKLISYSGDKETKNLSSSLKVFIYQEFSHRSLKYLVWESKSYNKILKCYYTRGFAMEIVHKIEEVVDLIITGETINEKDKLTIIVKKHIDIEEFRVLFSRYIYLLVEIEIFNKFLDETRETIFAKDGKILKSDEMVLDDNSFLDTIEYLPKRHFKKLKSNYKALVDQIKDESYTDSKLIIFSGMVNSIFNIEQAKE